MLAAEAFINITAKTAAFNSAMDGVKAKLSTVADGMRQVSAVSQIFLVGFGAVLGYAVKQAADFGETSSKFEAVFKDSTPAAQLWADNFATAVGRSKSELMGFMAQIQSVGVAMGFSRSDGLKLSETITQLAVDLASFNNMTDADALAALQSGILSGEAEPMKRFGVLLNDKALDKQLGADGVKGGSDAASEEQKVMARLRITLKATADAQGDAARTAGSVANSWKGLQAQVQETAIALGSALLPAIGEVMAVIKPIIKSVGDWMRNNQALTATVVGVVAGAAAALAVIAPLGAAIAGVVVVVKALFAAVMLLFSPITLIIAGIAALGVGLLYLTGTGNTFVERITSGFFKVLEVVSMVAGALVRAWAWVQDKVFGVMRGIVDIHLTGFLMVAGFVDKLTGSVLKLTEKMNGIKAASDGVFDGIGTGINLVDEFGKTLMNADAKKMQEGVGNFINDIKDKFKIAPGVDTDKLKKQFESLKAPDIKTAGGLDGKSKDKKGKDDKPQSAEDYFKQDMINRLIGKRVYDDKAMRDAEQAKAIKKSADNSEAIKMYAKVMAERLGRLNTGYAR